MKPKKRAHLLYVGLALVGGLLLLLVLFWDEVRGLPIFSSPKRPNFASLRRYTKLKAAYVSPRERVRDARKTKLEGIKQMFKDKGVTFPPRQLLFRIFKKELRLEVWAASRRTDELTHIVTYEVCTVAGELGPKRMEGDSQTPEGYYHVNRFNPASSYYLSMQVSYPNRSDRILKKGRQAGSHIMIHGECVSIGCVAVGDHIKELWILAYLSRKRARRIHVHMFPTRQMKQLIAKTRDPELEGFWGNLKLGFDYFERRRRIPRIGVDSRGRYRFR
jgi:murein L,D-transpeptidase YafK